jgi:antirestriction protein ArdC
MAAIKKKKDIRQELTDRIIEILENGEELPWKKDWKNVAVRPFNPYSGTRFKGGNVLTLLLAQSAKNSVDPRWMTFDQIKKSGFHLKPGSATFVEYWNFINKNKTDSKGIDDNDKDSTDRDDDERIMFARFYAEFNGDSIEGLPELFYQRPDFEPHEMVERLIKATGANIQHRTVTATGLDIKTDSAFFSHGNDTLVMPPIGSFSSAEGYYATFLHELCHWTGHEDRLARRAHGEKREMDSAEYAMEELRAEIGSCYLTAMFGLNSDIENHAAYTSHYLTLLKDEKNSKHILFRAAKDADEIIDYLFSFDPELRELLEGDVYQANNLHNEKAKDQDTEIVKSPELPDFTPKQTKSAPPASQKEILNPLTSEQAWERFLKTSADKCIDSNLGENYFQQIKIREKRDFEAHLRSLNSITGEEVDHYAVKIVQGWERASVIHDYWKAFSSQMRVRWEQDEQIIGDGIGNGRKEFFEGVNSLKHNFVTVSEIVKRDADFGKHVEATVKLFRDTFGTKDEPLVSDDTYRSVVLAHVPLPLLTNWLDSWQKNKISSTDQVRDEGLTGPSLGRYSAEDDDDLPVVTISPKTEETITEVISISHQPEVTSPKPKTVDVPEAEAEDDVIISTLGNAIDLDNDIDAMPLL